MIRLLDRLDRLARLVEHPQRVEVGIRAGDAVDGRLAAKQLAAEEALRAPAIQERRNLLLVAQRLGALAGLLYRRLNEVRAERFLDRVLLYGGRLNSPARSSPTGRGARRPGGGHDDLSRAGVTR